ncbi:MAG: AtpZ/AtpI family protein [Tissierellaceae bacterium]
MKKDRDYGDILKNISLISQLGISIITPILLGVFIGQLIDKWVGTQGIFVIVFIILGAGAGFLNIFKLTGTKGNKRK